MAMPEPWKRLPSANPCLVDPSILKEFADIIHQEALGSRSTSPFVFNPMCRCNISLARCSDEEQAADVKLQQLQPFQWSGSPSAQPYSWSHMVSCLPHGGGNTQQASLLPHGSGNTQQALVQTSDPPICPLSSSQPMALRYRGSYTNGACSCQMLYNHMRFYELVVFNMNTGWSSPSSTLHVVAPLFLMIQLWLNYWKTCMACCFMVKIINWCNYFAQTSKNYDGNDHAAINWVLRNETPLPQIHYISKFIGHAVGKLFLQGHDDTCHHHCILALVIFKIIGLLLLGKYVDVHLTTQDI